MAGGGRVGGVALLAATLVLASVSGFAYGAFLDPSHSKSYTASNGMRLVLVPAGTFTMGSPAAEPGRREDEGPRRTITVGKAFWMSTREVSQEQYRAMMSFNHSRHHGRKLPVTNVTWEDAMTFCRKLTEKERQFGTLAEGAAFTLPSEAQWEYACRAGSTGAWYGPIDDIAWYSETSGPIFTPQGLRPQPVGTKKANGFGLYDMMGNAWEWCLDHYHERYSQATRDERPWLDNEVYDRVSRGGCYFSAADSCRSAARLGRSPTYESHTQGFRVVLNLESGTASGAEPSVPDIFERLARLARKKTHGALQARSKKAPAASATSSVFSPTISALPGDAPVRGVPDIPAARTTSRKRKMDRVADLHLKAGSTMKSDEGVELSWVPPGTFEWTVPEEQRVGSKKDEATKKVTLTKGFWMSTHEVRQSLFKKVMGINPSRFGGGSRPVDSVSWHKAQEFCCKLSERAGKTYRLPLEYEWEYACRAGKDGPSESKPDAVAWYDLNSGKRTQEAGRKEPNEWGLYDMRGNVEEWCNDTFGLIPGYICVKGNPQKGRKHVLRGGGWETPARDCRATFRNLERPSRHEATFGFRVIREK